MKSSENFKRRAEEINSELSLTRAEKAKHETEVRNLKELNESSKSKISFVEICLFLNRASWGSMCMGVKIELIILVSLVAAR